MLLICNMIILPITVTFFRGDASSSMLGFYVVSDVCFILDICLNFRTGYMAQGCNSNIVLVPKSIAKRYFVLIFIKKFVHIIIQGWPQETSDKGTDASDEEANYFGTRALKPDRS